jgi:hypothetical protein
VSSGQNTERSPWIWDQPQPGRPTAAGDVTALFNTASFAVPELLSPLATSTSATVFAREVLQNSLDAHLATNHGSRPLGVDFRFVSIRRGDEARKFRRKLGLGHLQEHAETAARHDRKRLGLDSRDCLLDLDDEPLVVLQVVERGGAGMSGNWDEGRSAMERAMIRVGWAQERADAGGSYGFGKGGVAQASRIRTVVAYTAYPSREDDPGIDRRLLGVTYWKQHQIGRSQYTGWAMLGVAQPDDSVKPFDGLFADLFAKELGIPTRNPRSVADRGTTLLLPEPVFTAEQLRDAVLCSWWPALVEDHLLEVRVIDVDGRELDLAVTIDHPTLGAFVDAYVNREVGSPEREHELHGDLVRSSGPLPGIATIGRAAFVADPTGWSFPSRKAALRRERSIVAMMRGPRMVVKYDVLDVVEAPYVRGVFVASPAADPVLRQTEPAAHDDWKKTNLPQGVHPSAAKLVRAIDQAIEEIAEVLRERLDRQQPVFRATSTPICAQLLAGPATGSVKTKKKPPHPIVKRERRAVNVRLVHPELDIERPQVLQGVDPNTVRAAAWVEFELNDTYPKDKADLQIRLGLRFVEDETQGDFVPITTEPPPGFVAEAARGHELVFSGSVDKGERIRFLVTSDVYDDDFSTMFQATAEVRP